ncbi:DUF421 domain-containing protein [Corynebacterium uberis]|uniref:DUF421 domain-containing protein n=1 Tax=Corynebacterium TaxID=1716 RepID=UPI001D0B5362|nr:MULTISPECIES: YetF domain-containing protein [Corynebacterium]MCZ9308548.1 DUF421 domain-containing protein [Corynebacterium sp. c6VSa_13]UDL74200.1 DUF421 domain-containing protein [Corynebacterium uberis]UDL74917.1 DUF421 domain-containing protein [Corynebacterium uberis]UDL77131.1 DUF421 domain-containing protein [Corynebacterium uberis]UDL79414.1 DUF421 domain-containing protein [Corynebacterium uberis]
MVIPDVWMERLAAEVFIEPWRIPVVMGSACVIYVVFVGMLRVFGARVLSPMNLFDAVVIIMFGAVAGRVIIGHPPTLGAGVVGLCTLVALELVFGAARRVGSIRRVVDATPRVIIARGEFIDSEVHRNHLSRADIYAVLRRSGVSSMSQVRAMILEPSGGFSVVREGQPIDPEFLRGVVGAHRVVDEAPQEVEGSAHG